MQIYTGLTVIIVTIWLSNLLLKISIYQNPGSISLNLFCHQGCSKWLHSLHTKAPGQSGNRKLKSSLCSIIQIIHPQPWTVSAQRGHKSSMWASGGPLGEHALCDCIRLCHKKEPASHVLLFTWFHFVLLYLGWWKTLSVNICVHILWFLCKKLLAEKMCQHTVDDCPDDEFSPGLQHLAGDARTPGCDLGPKFLSRVWEAVFRCWPSLCSQGHTAVITGLMML